jgi:hypothetical protein
MKTLTAENDFGRTKQAIALADIMISETESVLDNKWAIFPRHIELAYSIGKSGLKKPIVLKKKNNKYAMTFGGNRLQVAALNNFSHIEAVIVETNEEVKALHDLMTQMPPHEGKSFTNGGRLP